MRFALPSSDGEISKEEFSDFIRVRLSKDHSRSQLKEAFELLDDMDRIHLGRLQEKSKDIKSDMTADELKALKKEFDKAGGIKVDHAEVLRMVKYATH